MISLRAALRKNSVTVVKLPNGAVAPQFGAARSQVLDAASAGLGGNLEPSHYRAVPLVDAVPQGGERLGADRGIDGGRWVRSGLRGEDLDRVVVSVKRGEDTSVRDQVGTVQRERALGGPLITLAPATREVLREPASQRFASTGLGQVRKVMVKTVEGLLRGVHDDAERPPPLGRQEGSRRTPRERRGAQGALEV